MCSSYRKCPQCSLKARQLISEGWQTAWLPLSRLPPPALSPTRTGSGAAAAQTVSLHQGVISRECAGTRMSVLPVLSPQQCSVPSEKKGLALLNPTDKAFLTMVYKGPFIHTVPKIATGCNHEMNTRLWIPLNCCLLTRTRNQCPAVASSPVVLVLSSVIKCWPFLSHLVLVPSFLQIFRILEILWEV